MLTLTSLASLIPVAQIQADVRASKRTAAIHEVSALLQNHPGMVNFQGFYADLLARDRLDTTSLGNGIALPHARTDHVKQLVVALGRSRAGIQFDTGGPPIHLIFVIGTPKSHAADYLMVVSSICRTLKEQANRQRLLDAADTPALAAVLRDLE